MRNNFLVHLNAFSTSYDLRHLGNNRNEEKKIENCDDDQSI